MFTKKDRSCTSELRKEKLYHVEKQCIVTDAQGVRFEAILANFSLSGANILCENIGLNVSKGDRLCVSIEEGIQHHGMVVRTYNDGFAMSLPSASLALAVMELT